MSRFVSAGTSDEPTERDEAWLKAQQQIEATRQQTQQKPRPGEQEGGKSLYETLQANKAAKQEKFEEENRLRNQFRSLDDDEVEFLDSVMESTRTKEAEVKKETNDQLDAFRRQQLDAEKAATQGEGSTQIEAAPATETWTAGPRKRKKGREGGFVGGVKLRRTSTIEQQKGPFEASKAPADQHVTQSPPSESKDAPAGSPSSAPAAEAKASTASPSSPAPKPVTAGLGLGAYSSDEDD